MAKKKLKALFIDDPARVYRLFYVFAAFCVLLFIADFFYHRHSYMTQEAWPGFYAVFGFVAISIMVMIARFVLRPIVMRDEDYYE